MVDLRCKAEWLPREEAEALKAAMLAEMCRLYDLDPEDPYGYKQWSPEEHAVWEVIERDRSRG